MTSQLQIKNPEEILTELENLRHKKKEMNWVLLGYHNQVEVVFVKTGSGGLNELKDQLKEDEINYAILEVAVQGDAYNPVKYLFITWIGSQVPPGVFKAKSAGHRAELIDFMKKKIGISGEFQPVSKADLDPKTIADKLTRVAKHEVGSVDQTRQQMSRAHKSSGDTKKSAATLVNKEEIIQGLKKVHKGEATWGLLGYVEGKKDEIQFLKTGNGLTSLQNEFPDDKILYAVVSLEVKNPTTSSITIKYLLVTLVGINTPSLTKARSASHREELLNYIKEEAVPIHSQFQALSKNDLNESEFLIKLRQ